MAIRYLEQKYINYTLWDRCISRSINSEIYVYSWYLDTIAGTWDAIIEDDYEFIMPLVFSGNFFSKKIYQHPLVKHVGIFSGSPVKAEKIFLFLNAIPKKFGRIEICFNRQNTQAIKEPLTICRNVYELDMIIPYERKIKSYSVPVKQALEVARKRKLSVMHHISIFELHNLLHQSPVKISEELIITPLLRILSRLISLSKAEIIGIYGPENTCYAAGCFIRSGNNVILIFGYTLPLGVETNANYLLLDSFLESYSGRNVTLSLEHIDDVWNDDFYTAFGALRSYQYCFARNRIFRPFRWIF